MESLLILIAGYLLLAPLVAIVLFVNARKRQGKLEERVRELALELALLRRQAGSVPADAREQEPVEARSSSGAPVAAPPAEPAAPAQTPPPRAVPVVPEAEPVSEDEAVPEPAREPEPFTAAARVAPRVAAPEPEPAKARGDSLAGLRRIGLWPPAASADSGGREAVLMQWWLPRIGGLLALLSALFFGVYINRSTSEIFKFLELAAVSLGVVGLGLFFEKRQKQFGGVLFVTGLILCYLTSVAAYALPAVKIIANPLAGALFQALVLIAIVAIGLWRRSVSLVFLAYGFGLFLTIFMAWTGLREGALVASLLLVYSGAVVARLRRLDWLVALLVPGAYLVPLAHVISAGMYPLQLPETGSILVFLQLVLLWYPAWRIAKGGTVFSFRDDRILTGLHTSLAIVAGVAYFRTFSPLDVEWLYLILGIHFLVWSIILWFWRRVSFHSLLFFIKGSFLLSAWVITVYAGDLRWMILALQTVVLASGARWARSRWLEATTWVTAAIALYMHNGAVATGEYPDGGSFLWWMHALLPLVFIAAASWLLPVSEGQARILEEKDRRDSALWLLRVAYALAALVCVSLVWMHLTRTPNPNPDAAPRVWLLYAYAAAAIVFIPGFSRWLPALFSGAAFLVGTAIFWNRPFDESALVLIPIWAVAAVCALVRRVRAPRPFLVVAEIIVWLAFLPAIASRLLLETDGWDGTLPLLYLAGACALFLGRFSWTRQLGGLAFILPLIGTDAVARIDSVPWAWIAVASGLIFTFMPQTDEAIRKGLGVMRWKNLWSWAAAIVLWLNCFSLPTQEGAWIQWSLLFALTAGAFIVAAHVWRVSGWTFGASLFLASAFFYHASATLSTRFSAWSWELLLSGLLLTTLFLCWSLWLRPASKGFAVVRYVSAAAIFAIWALTFYSERLGWRDVYTPLLAAVVIALIIVGLVRREKAFRLTGLVLLLVPLTRLFVVDVQDALYRIIAFGVSAVCLTAIGYLYHRLSARLT